MIKHIPSLLVLASIVSSATCFANERSLVLCETADQKYTVWVVQAEEGLRAAISKKLENPDGDNQPLASYDVVKAPEGALSASFGEREYKDSAGKFLLRGPATNIPGYKVMAKFENGQELVDDNLNCDGDGFRFQW